MVSLLLAAGDSWRLRFDFDVGAGEGFIRWWETKAKILLKLKEKLTADGKHATEMTLAGWCAAFGAAGVGKPTTTFLAC